MSIKRYYTFAVVDEKTGEDKATITVETRYGMDDAEDLAFAELKEGDELSDLIDSGY